jgi:peroxiredoxin Q/BCP
MQGHQAKLEAYGSLNAQVVGVSRDDVQTLQYWKKHLRLSFPLLSNISGYLGSSFGVVKEGSFPFERRTVIIDKKATIRYARDGSPDYEEILRVLKDLNGGK